MISLARRRSILVVLFLLAISTIGISSSSGHGGGLDSQGGHNCYVGSCAGTYHCHQSWGPGCGGGTSAGPSSTPVTPKCISNSATSLTKRNWAKVQKQLKASGYSPGAVDGRFGPKTLAALRAYESDNGLAKSSLSNIRVTTLEELNAYCG